MRTVVERRVDDELRLEAQRSRELLHRAGVSEDDLSRVLRCSFTCSCALATA